MPKLHVVPAKRYASQIVALQREVKRLSEDFSHLRRALALEENTRRDSFGESMRAIQTESQDNETARKIGFDLLADRIVQNEKAARWPWPLSLFFRGR